MFCSFVFRRLRVGAEMDLTLWWIYSITRHTTLGPVKPEPGLS